MKIQEFVKKWKQNDCSRLDDEIENIITNKIIPCIKKCLGDNCDFTPYNIIRIMEVNNSVSIINTYLRSINKKLLTDKTRLLLIKICKSM